MHENLKKKITDHLIEKYSPEIIILHGSRASENYRPHSDWDIFIFIKNQPEGMQISREIFEDQALDIALISYPNITHEVLEKLVAVSHSIENLWENELGSGQKLIQDALAKRNQGKRLSQEAKELIVFDMYKDINNLTDLQENNPVFFFRLGYDFFRHALNGWFRVIRNEYSLPPYLSIPYIQKYDPEYYSLLEVLWSNKSNHEKVKAAKSIFERIKECV